VNVFVGGRQPDEKKKGDLDLLAQWMREG